MDHLVLGGSVTQGAKKRSEFWQLEPTKPVSNPPQRTGVARTEGAAGQSLRELT